MKVWIIYDSKFGNNKHVAEFLANKLQPEHAVEVHHAKEVTPRTVLREGIDGLVIGGPPRVGMISFTIKRWAKKMGRQLQKQQKQLKIFAAWATHARNTPDTPEKFGWAGLKLKWQALTEQIPAENRLPDIYDFPVNPETLEGPLDPGWEEQVQDIAAKISGLIRP